MLNNQLSKVGFQPWGMMMLALDHSTPEALVDSTVDACAYVEYLMRDMEHKCEVLLRYAVEGQAAYKTMAMEMFDPTEFQDVNANKVFHKYMQRVQKAIFNRVRKYDVTDIKIELRLPGADFFVEIETLKTIADKMMEEGLSFEEYAGCNMEEYMHFVVECARDNGYLIQTD